MEWNKDDRARREELGSWRILSIGAAVMLSLFGVAAVIAALHGQLSL